MTSKRLPGKVLLPFRGQPMIRRIIQRVQAALSLSAVCVAVPDSDESIPLLTALMGLDVLCAVGPEDDVLRRYVIAAEMSRAEVIVRVTADCPFIDPVLIDATVAMRRQYNLPFLDAKAFHGSEVEVFTREALLDADLWATDPYDREHVGPYMRRKYAVNYCVDTPEDYARLTA